jgi:hypothetical protein
MAGPGAASPEITWELVLDEINAACVHVCPCDPALEESRLRDQRLRESSWERLESLHVTIDDCVKQPTRSGG